MELRPFGLLAALLPSRWSWCIVSEIVSHERDNLVVIPKQLLTLVWPGLPVFAVQGGEISGQGIAQFRQGPTHGMNNRRVLVWCFHSG